MIMENWATNRVPGKRIEIICPSGVGIPQVIDNFRGAIGDVKESGDILIISQWKPESKSFSLEVDGETQATSSEIWDIISNIEKIWAK